VANRIEYNEFANLQISGIHNPGESVIVLGNSFEPNLQGQASGIAWDNLMFSMALNIMGNWFGDVSAGSGRAWIDVGANGLSIVNNRLATAGVDGRSIKLTACTGVSINGNFLEGPIGIEYSDNIGGCHGVFVGGNDFTGCPTPVVGASNAYNLAQLGNRGLANVTS
jgi:hypothetical protein